MKISDVTDPSIQLPERRFEAREPAKACYNAEIKIVGYPIYQVKLADVSQTGAGLLVNEGSSLLSLLQVGRLLEVRFNFEDQPGTDVQFKAEVKHISDMKENRYKGHKMVGISLVQKMEPDRAFNWPSSISTPAERQRTD